MLLLWLNKFNIWMSRYRYSYFFIVCLLDFQKIYGCEIIGLFCFCERFMALGTIIIICLFIENKRREPLDVNLENYKLLKVSKTCYFQYIYIVSPLAITKLSLAEYIKTLGLFFGENNPRKYYYQRMLYNICKRLGLQIPPRLVCKKHN